MSIYTFCYLSVFYYIFYMPQIKKSHEIEKIKQACQITDRIFAKMRKFLDSSLCSEWLIITEKQLETWLLAKIKQAGCTPSFHPIIAAWPNAAHPHWKADDTPLQWFVVIDFGVVYQGYMSDMTRTIYVSAGWQTKSWKPKFTGLSDKERQFYNLVLRAQLDSMAYIMPGRYCKDAHWVAATTLGEYNKCFIHSLGHGIGTIIHEHPRISPKGRWYFKKNMCITVEPGVYIEGNLGIRIEDTCLVTEVACIPLTKSTKKLLYF